MQISSFSILALSKFHFCDTNCPIIRTEFENCRRLVVSVCVFCNHFHCDIKKKQPKKIVLKNTALDRYVSILYWLLILRMVNKNSQNGEELKNTIGKIHCSQEKNSFSTPVNSVELCDLKRQ